MARQHHPLIQSLLDLKGNPRACVYTEPLWGIAYNLYAPFAALYMSQLGISDARIGLLLSVGMGVQMVTCLLGGAIIDRHGRRRSTFILGLLSWSIPTLLLLMAQNFWWFLLAALFSGINLAETVAWSCLFVEDAEPDRLVDMYNWVTISGLLAVFFAPAAGFLVRALSLVTAMRFLYGFAFIMMTVKIVLLFLKSHETQHGRVRIRETRGVPFYRQLGEQRGIIRLILGNPASMQLLAIIVLIHVTNLITTSFFALYATRNAAVPDWVISYFPMARSAVMLIFIFGIQNRIASHPIRRVMLVGLALYLSAIVFLLLAPGFGSLLLAGYILLDAFAYALVWPRRNSLVAMYVDPQERARVLGLLNVLMIACASPFGWVAGWLSERNHAFPFVLNAILYIVCGIVLYRARQPAGDRNDDSRDETRRQAAPSEPAG